jgi:hypothetical protein
MLHVLGSVCVCVVRRIKGQLKNKNPVMHRRAFIDVCQHGYMYLVPGTKVHIYIYYIIYIYMYMFR